MGKGVASSLTGKSPVLGLLFLHPQHSHTSSPRLAKIAVESKAQTATGHCHLRLSTEGFYTGGFPPFTHWDCSKKEAPLAVSKSGIFRVPSKQPGKVTGGRFLSPQPFSDKK